jgi:hypothetical protein
MKTLISIRRSSASTAVWGKQKKAATSHAAYATLSFNDPKLFCRSKSLPARTLPSSSEKKAAHPSKNNLRVELLNFQKRAKPAMELGADDCAAASRFSRAPAFRRADDFLDMLTMPVQRCDPAVSPQQEEKSVADLALENKGKYAAVSDASLPTSFADFSLVAASKRKAQNGKKKRSSFPEKLRQELRKLLAAAESPDFCKNKDDVSMVSSSTEDSITITKTKLLNKRNTTVQERGLARDFLFDEEDDVSLVSAQTEDSIALTKAKFMLRNIQGAKRATAVQQ